MEDSIKKAEVANEPNEEEHIESEDLMNGQITIFDTHPELWQGHALVKQVFTL